MVATQHEIEAIVREVLRRLAHAGSVTPPVAVAPPAASGELRIDRRVVTLAALDGAPDSLRRLIVPRNAVVTPAVQDELKNRGVALAFASVSSTAARSF